MTVTLGSGTEPRHQGKSEGARDKKNRLPQVLLHQRAGFTPAQAGTEPLGLSLARWEDVLVGKGIRRPQKPEGGNIPLGLGSGLRAHFPELQCTRDWASLIASGKLPPGTRSKTLLIPLLGTHMSFWWLSFPVRVCPKERTEPLGASDI